MKKIIAGTMITLTTFTTASAESSKSVRRSNFTQIENEGDESDKRIKLHSSRNTRDDIESLQDQNDRLRKRVRTLERAVVELQDAMEDIYDRIPGLASGGTSPGISNSKMPWVCVLKSEFDNAHIGKGATKLEASANAINACRASAKGNFCSESSVACEKAGSDKN